MIDLNNYVVNKFTHPNLTLDQRLDLSEQMHRKLVKDVKAELKQITDTYIECVNDQATRHKLEIEVMALLKSITIPISQDQLKLEVISTENELAIIPRSEFTESLFKQFELHEVLCES